MTVDPLPPSDPVPPQDSTPAPQRPRSAFAERVASRRDRRESPKHEEPKPPVLDKQDIAATPPKLRELDAMIEAEMEAALSGLSEKDIFGEPAAAPRGPKALAEAKPVKTGRVLSVNHGSVFIDVPGGRSQGIISGAQFPEGLPKPGDSVEFQIEGYDPGDGLLILTRKGAAVEADWSSIQIGQTVEARVTEVNKGGLSVEVNGIRGFLPISQIDLYRVENAEQYVNQKLLCLVAEVHPEERNLVVSRRALLERDKAEMAEKAWGTIAEGQIRKGVVRSVKEFGAFVDLGGIDGLIPMGELSWSRVKDAGEIVSPGQTVEVAVVRVDREKRKVSLSLRQLAASPWEKIAGEFPPRSLARGKVTRIADFGAFVEVAPGIEGLIHVSELAPNRVFRVSAVVKEGQDVEVMVLGVDPEKQRMSLSLKQAAKAKEPPPAPKVEEPEEAEAEVPTKPKKPRKDPLRGGMGGGGPLFPNLPSMG
ncbi:MAG: S1 RNA-binding domain-containing protein [Gemmataceae bacterium]